MKESPQPCHPERGLIFAPKREDQPQSKDPYTLIILAVDSWDSHEKLT